MRIIEAKRIIQPNNGFNLYRGCLHGCIYCDSRSLCYQVGDFENIAIKKNTLGLVEAELGRKRKKAVLRTGAMSDPYIPLEKELCLMQGVLKHIARFGFGISVLTKSSLIERDIDWYEKINTSYRSVVQMTITTLSDELARKIEPHVSLPSERIRTLKKFADQNIPTGIWMTPILPFLLDTKENITEIVEAAHAANVRFIVSFGMGTTMREGSREYFYTQLDRLFPGLKERYIETYHDRYICPSPKERELTTLFQTLCDTYGIAYSWDQISHFFEPREPKQLTLFSNDMEGD
jgi:DNA repair photolyase